MKKLLISALLFLLASCSTTNLVVTPPTDLITELDGCTNNCLDIIRNLPQDEINMLYGAAPTSTNRNVRLLRLTDPPNTQNPRANFTDDFKGRATRFTYTNSIGQVIAEDYVTVLGMYNKTLDVLALGDSDLGNPADLLPTAPLAAEHHWMSFELLMKGQREYRGCVARISEIQRRLGVACKIDDKCSSLYSLIIALSEYWVPWNITDNFGEHPAGKRTYIGHFKAGLFGLNQIVAHRDACRAGLAGWRVR